MDIFSHGLYGGVLTGRKSRKSFWTAFIFGISPDLFSFGIFTLSILLGFVSGPDWGSHAPDPSLIPNYVGILYDITHSLIVFSVAFLAVWLIRGKPMMEMLAWGFHVALDIFTHSFAFFPTPFLWPISNYKFDGHSWGTSEIFIPNVIALCSLYAWWWYKKSSFPNEKRNPK